MKCQSMNRRVFQRTFDCAKTNTFFQGKKFEREVKEMGVVGAKFSEASQEQPVAPKKKKNTKKKGGKSNETNKLAKKLEGFTIEEPDL